MTEPTYLSLDALESEALPEPFRFQIRGEKFDMQSSFRPSEREALVSATETSDYQTVLLTFFGTKEDAARFEALDLHDGHVKLIFDTYYEHVKQVQGLNPGESAASSDSSSGTGRRSKPTSRTSSRR